MQTANQGASTSNDAGSIPGAGDILGVNDRESVASPTPLESPVSPGLDLSLQHQGANARDAALTFLNRMDGSIGRARDALNALGDNPALDFVLSVGGMSRALQALNDLESSTDRPKPR